MQGPSHYRAKIISEGVWGTCERQAAAGEKRGDAPRRRQSRRQGGRVPLSWAMSPAGTLELVKWIGRLGDSIELVQKCFSRKGEEGTETKKINSQ